MWYTSPFVNGVNGQRLRRIGETSSEEVSPDSEARVEDETDLPDLVAQSILRTLWDMDTLSQLENLSESNLSWLSTSPYVTSGFSISEDITESIPARRLAEHGK